MIQEVFWNSKISSLLSKIVDKIQNSKLMQRNIPTNLFGCLYSLLKKKLHFGILFLYLVLKFKWNKLQFICHNVDMHPQLFELLWILLAQTFGRKKIKVASDNKIRLRAKLDTKQFREGHIVWRKYRSKHDGVIFNW